MKISIVFFFYIVDTSSPENVINVTATGTAQNFLPLHTFVLAANRTNLLI